MQNKVEKTDKGLYVLTECENGFSQNKSSYAVIVGEITPLTNTEMISMFDSFSEEEKVKAVKHILEKKRGFAFSNVYDKDGKIKFGNIVKIENVPDSLE